MGGVDGFLAQIDQEGLRDLVEGYRCSGAVRKGGAGLPAPHGTARTVRRRKTNFTYSCNMSVMGPILGVFLIV